MPDYEVELKFRMDRDPSVFEQQLVEHGARRIAESTQEDIYFSHPQRDFSVTDEALRVRRSGLVNVVTYKGPLLDALSKTRQEIEIPFAEGQQAADQMWALLRALGFRDVRRVEKVRREFLLDWDGRPFTISMDRVTGLGDYVELETLPPDGDWQAARDSALRLASCLLLTDHERRSYLQLLLLSDAAQHV